MGTGWRRAFCTIRREQETAMADKHQHSGSPSPSPSPRSCARLGFFSSRSNPTTPRLHSQSVSSPSLRCKTSSSTIKTTTAPAPAPAPISTLHCKTTTTSTKPKSPKSPNTALLGSNPTSPRSPLKFSLFKNSFKFRSSCGICLNSVKTGQGTAIYTAECSHAFHFPCIAEHVRKHGTLVCPVCNTCWKNVPLLAIHKNLHMKDAASTTTTSSAKSKSDDIKQDISSSSSSPRSQTPNYDDDEPLLTPTAKVGRFNPIPEADEEENDVEEFRGFFVNPNPSDEIPFHINGRDSRNVHVILLPESAVVSSNSGYETYAVSLIVKAPPPASRFGNRAPIDLVTVLDVSETMTGPKLQMLKRAMRLVISSLGSADRLSIVAFSATPKRLLPLKRMTAQGQRAARLVVDRLVCGQGTCVVGDSLRKATKVLEDRRERNPVASIMLLCDGQDERVNSNAPHQRQGSSHVPSTRYSHIEIPVHSFRFGKSGGYSQAPAEDVFAKCVGGLLSVVVQDLRIQLSLASGSAPAEISGVYSWNALPSVLSSGSVRLGDLYAEEERELLVELRVPISAVGSQQVMSLRCLYKDPATQEVVYGQDRALLVPRPQAVRSSAPEIQRFRNLFITTRAMAESRRLRGHNNFTSAYHLLASARALLVQSGLGTADEYVRMLEAELAEVHWRRQQMIEIDHQDQGQQMMMTMIQRRRGRERDENGEPLTPISAWRAAEKLAKVATMKKSLNRVSDLHGFENARF
ncbi:zf-RING_2 domain-containing protein/VWA_3 domain-containing protein [Cephalotus follicularis]|uniref:Zf-RING_2 domain-containing protein/VWA_3 domain-containing protein n=1 Tax=Cephalotus follicularis TaxID=3775 RepID=A0A1Q3AQN4_CEPFO|nr:zf-RING_2 domain-containing protein/VWA_3 domain-containing protein [Cephalotus follicularis]